MGTPTERKSKMLSMKHLRTTTYPEQAKQKWEAEPKNRGRTSTLARVLHTPSDERYTDEETTKTMMQKQRRQHRSDEIAKLKNAEITYEV